jgi:hypothetical protein
MLRGLEGWRTILDANHNNSSWIPGVLTGVLGTLLGFILSWMKDREALIAHLTSEGEAAVARLGGLDERLRKLVETKVGQPRLAALERATAPFLGRQGVETFRAEITEDSSLYDAYNHLTFVSQQRKLGPRRELELVAGRLLGTM